MCSDNAGQDLLKAIKQANPRNISFVDIPMQILRDLELKVFIDIVRTWMIQC